MSGVGAGSSGAGSAGAGSGGAGSAPQIDLTRHIHSGDRIWWSQTSAEPTPLVHALLDQLPAIGPVTAFVGLTLDKRVTSNPPAELSVISYGALGDLRHLSREGRLEVIPANYSSLGRLFANGSLPNDVALVQVSSPDENGLCSLGVGVDYAADAIIHSRVIIAEINERMPATIGSDRIHISRFDATVRTDRPLLEAPLSAPNAVDLAIAGHIAALVDDGDTIQLGVGALPTAVLAELRGHRDLGVHSGLVSDGIVDLFDRGVLTGARKEIDRGVIVTGAALGSTAFYERLSSLPIEFRPSTYTHSPATLSHFGALVSINSAIEVDLTGQVNAEVRRGTYIGAVGGQSDFSRAASLTGARSIIALRSTSGRSETGGPGRSGGTTSAIVATTNTVTTSRTDVDVVVTEHGVAHLRGCGFAERARRLVAIASPEHREELERASASSDRASETSSETTNDRTSDSTRRKERA